MTYVKPMTNQGSNHLTLKIMGTSMGWNWRKSGVLQVPYYLGNFDTNYIIFKNVEIFQKEFK